MANETNLKVLWPATYKVASAGWVADAYVGKWLVDAGGNRFTIIGNTTDTLILKGTTKPNAGIWAQYTGAGWTVDQYRSSTEITWLFRDSLGKTYPILQNTADTLVINVSAADPEPSVPPAAIVRSGHVVVDLPDAPDNTGAGVWQIVDAAGTVLKTWETTTGEVTSTAGGETTPAALPVKSVPIDLRGCDSLSVVAGFLAGASSPSGSLKLLVNNKPGPGAGATEDWNAPGPDQLDTGWVATKVSLDGAAASASAAIADTSNHLVVPSAHPNSPTLRARWGMLQWVPAGSPGTGNLAAGLYAYGAQG
jgi:hypothetical protein